MVEHLLEPFCMHPNHMQTWAYIQPYKAGRMRLTDQQNWDNVGNRIACLRKHKVRAKACID